MPVPRKDAARRLVGALALGLIAGCAALPPPSEPLLSGRLALQVDADGTHAAQSFSAGFELSGDAERGHLQLTTPLGTTLAQARWAPGVARLVTPRGEQEFADLDSLSKAALGEILPLRALPDWLHGRAWPGAPSHADVAAGGFSQLGWTVDLARFDQGWLLASRPGPPRVRLRARLDEPR